MAWSRITTEIFLYKASLLVHICCLTRQMHRDVEAAVMGISSCLCKLLQTLGLHFFNAADYPLANSGALDCGKPGTQTVLVDGGVELQGAQLFLHRNAVHKVEVGTFTPQQELSEGPAFLPCKPA